MMSSCSSHILVVSGKNIFSVKLAHAKAGTILSEQVRPIDTKNQSFVIETSKKEDWTEFVNWCHRMTKSPENSVMLQVDMPLT